MRKVQFKKWINRAYDEQRKPIDGTGCFTDFIHEGLFHQWGTASTEGENNFGNDTIAIIEEPDGTIYLPLPQHIKFIL